MSYPQAQTAEACDRCMETGRAKVLDGFLHGARADFETAAAYMENCAPALWCCAALSFMLDDKCAAKEYALRAERNIECVHSDISQNVYEDVWAEYMNRIISMEPLEGSDITVNHEESLPALPHCFRTTSSSPQKLDVKSLLTPKIERSLRVELRNENRAGDAVEVSLIVRNAEFSVPSFFKTTEAQGYFVYEFDIDASPCKSWKGCCELITTVPSGSGSNSPSVQNQSVSAYGAQFGTSGPVPGGNISYTYSQAITFSSLQEQMIAYKTDDQKVWRCRWKVNKYANGQTFDAKAATKEVSELPFDPSSTRACSNLGSFQGTWKVTSLDARKLHYHFDWEITLRANLALVPRRRKRDMVPMAWSVKMHPQEPLIHVSRGFFHRMSDFSSTSKDRLLT